MQCQRMIRQLLDAHVVRMRKLQLTVQRFTKV